MDAITSPYLVILAMHEIWNAIIHNSLGMAINLISEVFNILEAYNSSNVITEVNPHCLLFYLFYLFFISPGFCFIGFSWQDFQSNNFCSILETIKYNFFSFIRIFPNKIVTRHIFCVIMFITYKIFTLKIIFLYITNCVWLSKKAITQFNFQQIIIWLKTI